MRRARTRTRPIVLVLCSLVALLLTHSIALPLYAQSPAETSPMDEPDAESGQPVPDTQPRVHVVVAGESLSVIAERYGVSMAALMAENGITDPDSIRMGSRLRLPAAVERPVVGVDSQYAADDEPAEHVVLPGETVLGIALRYGLSPAELMVINGISNPDHIVIGRRLRLSPAPETEPARAPDATAGEAEPVEEAAPVADEDPDREASPEESEAPDPTEPQADAPLIDDPLPDETPLAESQVEPELLEREPVEPLRAISTLNRRIEVRPGDTIAGIALRHGVNEEALRQINGLGRSAALAVGQELVLPATRQELTAPGSSAISAPDEGLLDDGNVYHEVQRGESLGLIAQTYGLTLADLLAANRINDPNNILIGQRLLIPEPDSEDEDELSPRNVRLGRPQRGYFFYTVQPGDTLSQLAREFNTTFLAILDYNNLPDPETVYRGVDLRIPFGPPSLPVTAPPSPQSGTRFVVSLSRQQCWVFQGDRIIHEWICSTGYGAWITRTGVFAVQTKLEMAQSSYYELDMPFWLGIYDVGAAENGIHGLPIDWATNEKIWEGLLGQPATFGCAMLADEDAAALFDLAYLGMPVYIVN